MSTPLPRRLPRHPPPVPPHPLLSPSSLLFIGSWRGQLLIVATVTLVGFIYYFVIREPVERWRRHRRERGSKKAVGELMKLEKKRVEREREKEREREREAAAASKVGAETGSNGSGSREGANVKSGGISGPSAGSTSSASASGSTLSPSAERGRERRKEERKKRKSSLLKLPAGGHGSSVSPSPNASASGSASATMASTPLTSNSLENSPAPTGRRVELPHPSRSDEGKARSSVAPALIGAARVGEVSDHRIPANGSLQPEQLSSDQTSSASPLRPATMASVPPTSSSTTDDALETDTDRASVPTDTDQGERRPSASEGFSIFPEDGYLPASAVQGLNKRKKKEVEKEEKKGRGKGKEKAVASSSGASRSMAMDTSSSGDAQPNAIPSSAPGSSSSEVVVSSSLPERRGAGANVQHGGEDKPTDLPTPSRPSFRSHSRKSSLGGRPSTMDSQELLDERDRTIDALRAEIGLAKAEEAKAREEAERARTAEERMGKEAEKVRRRVEGDMKRREGELKNQIAQTSHILTAQLTHIAALEHLLRTSGLQIPPAGTPTNNANLSSAGNGGSFFAIPSRMASLPGSPMPVSLPAPASPSPFGMGGLGGMGYPSPSINGAGRLGSPMIAGGGGGGGYPSPGMYPSPTAGGAGAGGGNASPGMLHPNFLLAQQQQHQQHQMLLQQHQLHQLQHQHQQQHFAQSSSSPSPHSANFGIATSHPSAPLSPSPLRRPSGLGAGAGAGGTAGFEADMISLAGPLTPGMPPYPELGMGMDARRPGSGSSSSNGRSISGGGAGASVSLTNSGVGIGGAMDPARRMSIEFSVMKKKSKVEGEEAAAAAGMAKDKEKDKEKEAIVEEKEKETADGARSVVNGVQDDDAVAPGDNGSEGSMQGLGVGVLEGITSTFTGLNPNPVSVDGTDSSATTDQDPSEQTEADAEAEADMASASSSSHPTSPSPGSKRQLLVTPAISEVFSATVTQPGQSEDMIRVRNGGSVDSVSGSGSGSGSRRSSIGSAGVKADLAMNHDRDRGRSDEREAEIVNGGHTVRHQQFGDNGMMSTRQPASPYSPYQSHYAELHSQGAYSNGHCHSGAGVMNAHGASAHVNGYGTAFPHSAYNMNGTHGGIESGDGGGQGQGDADDDDDDAPDVDGAADPMMGYTPTFASLAHTPEQLREIARQREAVLKKHRSASATSVPGLGVRSRRSSQMG